MAVQSNVLTTELQSLASNAGAAVSDLAGVVAGADVLASQFDALRNAMQDVADLAGILRDSGFYTPVGSIVPFAGSAEPDGWYLCDGRAWGAGGAPSNSSALFNVIGSAFPAGLPNLSGKVIAGVGTILGSARTVGASVGAESLPAHTHDMNHLHYTNTVDLEHAHGFTDNNLSATNQGQQLASGSFYGRFSFADASAGDATGGMSGNRYHSHNTTESSGTGLTYKWNGSSWVLDTNTGSTGSGTHGVVQPTIVLNYLIKG